MIRALVIVALLTIVGSLLSALLFLVKDPSRSPRTVKALTVRIVISIGLFLMLFIAYALGWIQPHGIRPPGSRAGTVQGSLDPRFAIQPRIVLEQPRTRDNSAPPADGRC